MKRRNFIKKSLLTGSGLLLSPFFVKSDTEAAPSVKLNYFPQPSQWNNQDITLSWLGHSTILINMFGKWIITDPALFERVGVYFLGSTIGPTRITPPALRIDQIPKPDLILLSHAHMDHTDYPTLKAIANKFPDQIDVVVAYLTKDVIDDLPWRSITVLDWGEESIVQDIRVKAYEVKHFGWRFPWERDRSRGYFKDGRSYNAYVFEYKGKKILFGGDTANTDKLKAAAHENVDIALMPIGAYNPWTRAHCNPEEAIKMAAEINAKYFVPMHTKTFAQGREPFNEPIDWMIRAASDYNLKIGLEEIGQTFTLS